MLQHHTQDGGGGCFGADGVQRHGDGSGYVQFTLPTAVRLDADTMWSIARLMPLTALFVLNHNMQMS
jgi:hypothetical protein